MIVKDREKSELFFFFLNFKEEEEEGWRACGGDGEKHEKMKWEVKKEE